MYTTSVLLELHHRVERLPARRYCLQHLRQDEHGLLQLSVCFCLLGLVVSMGWYDRERSCSPIHRGWSSVLGSCALLACESVSITHRTITEDFLT